MKKGIALIMALVLALGVLSGCNLIGYDAELDGAQIVAKVGDHEITKATWESYRDYLAQYEQQYYMQYYGFSFDLDEETMAAYGETALEQLIQSYVVEDKIAELGLDQLSEEEIAEVEEYAASMADFYKLMLRYQLYPDVETVEEEAARLTIAAEATPSEASEAEPAEPVATITDAELDEMLTADLEAAGYTYDYFYNTEESTRLEARIREHAVADVAVTDEEVLAEFDNQVATQQTAFDATPSLYTSYQNSGYDVYYVPVGYRGVKNLLVMIDEEKQTQIADLESALATAESAVTSLTEQVDTLKAEDTAGYDAETLAEYDEQLAALEAELAESQTAQADAQAQLDALTEEAFAEILPVAEEALAKAQAGENFDELVAAYGEDPGMTVEPTMTEGYWVCEGLAVYEQAFQDAAMALENVGDVSAELVRTSYGYHVLQYATDIASGAVEYTDEIKTALHDTLLETAQNAAYEAAITQWVSEAGVETFPKVMK